MSNSVARNLLVVDDDPHVLGTLERLFVRSGYRTHPVADPARARMMLDVVPIDAVVTDLNLWLADGRTFAATVTQDCTAPVIVMTGMQDFAEVTHLLGGSAPRALIAKPFDIARVKDVVSQVLREADAKVEHERALTCELASGMARALALRDVETEAHAQRVALWTRQIATAVGMDEHARFWAEIGALLHDVGKIGVPDTILKKPGPLDAIEWAIMRRHSELGAELLAPVRRLAGARDVVLYHHEAWDGSGYPHGLAGEAIPLAARVFAPVDAYDAMTSDRPYRRGMPHAQALAELVRGRGTHFDPAVVDAILAIATDDWLLVRSAVAAGETLCASAARAKAPQQVEAFG